MKQKLLCFFLLGFMLIGSAYAQDKRIQGRVTSEQDGSPLSGVSVQVVGTSITTQTDGSGNYSIVVPSERQSLVFTYVGYAPVTRRVSTATTIDVVLQVEQTELDEVVVVAYGTQRRRDLIGSVSTVSSEQIKKQQLTSVTQGLQGTTTGVLVINGTGQPGSEPTIRVRGVGSYSASSSPLIVLDGIAYGGSLNSINPNDVEEMSVLSDAAATALYGSRAANGVILITTKKGKAGDAQIDAYATYGTSSRAIREYDYLSPEDYFKLAWEAQYNYAMYDAANAPLANPGQYATDNLIAGSGNAYGLRYNPFGVANPVDASGNLVSGAQLLWNTDWYKEASNETIGRRNVGASFAGGSDKYTYYMSADYLDQDGQVRNSNFKRLSVRLNADAQLRDWLKVGLNTSVATMDNFTPNQAGSAYANSVQFARIVSSIYPLYRRGDDGSILLDAAGEPMYDFGGSVADQLINNGRPTAANMNAIALNRLDKSTADNYQTVINAYAEVGFTEHLKFKSVISTDRYYRSLLTYANPLYGDAQAVQGRVRRERHQVGSYTFSNSLTYDRRFGAHNLNLLANMEAMDYNTQSLVAATTGFPLPGLEEIGPGANKETATSSTNVRRIVSYLGRAAYNFDSRYYFEGSVRTDGSTRFMPDNRWGVFYSLGAAWDLSREDFMADQTLFDMLKIRASYGEVGNEGLSSYFPYLSAYNAGWNDMTNPGITLGDLGNPNISWEKLGTYNIALDFAMWRNRFSGSLAYYEKNTFDLLFAKPLPNSSGVVDITTNIGNVSNKGFELTLNSHNINRPDFTWNTHFNLATLTNTVTSMPQEALLLGSRRLEEGKSLYEFYIYEWAGVNPDNGLPQWYADDPNNEGETIVVNSIANARRSYQGSALPKVTGGLSNTMTYKSFDFSFIFNYAFGGKILDSDYIRMMHGFSALGSTLHTDILDRWQKPGDVTDVPRLKFGQSDYGNASTRHLFSGDYIRLRNVTFGYNLPRNAFGSGDVIKNARVYLQADNFFTWSKLKKGADPEVSIAGTTSQSSAAFKTISLGLNIGF